MKIAFGIIGFVVSAGGALIAAASHNLPAMVWALASALWAFSYTVEMIGHFIREDA